MWPGQLPADLLQQVLAADPPLHTRGKSRFVAGATQHNVSLLTGLSLCDALSELPVRCRDRRHGAALGGVRA